MDVRLGYASKWVLYKTPLSGRGDYVFKKEDRVLSIKDIYPAIDKELCNKNIIPLELFCKLQGYKFLGFTQHGETIWEMQWT